MLLLRFQTPYSTQRTRTTVIQPDMAQKPLLRGEVGCACIAREVSVERGGMGERGCARRLGVGSTMHLQTRISTIIQPHMAQKPTAQGRRPTRTAIPIAGTQRR